VFAVHGVRGKGPAASAPRPRLQPDAEPGHNSDLDDDPGLCFAATYSEAQETAADEFKARY
jgi:hypothetical protein